MDKFKYCSECGEVLIDEDNSEGIEMSSLLEESGNEQNSYEADLESPHQTDKYYCLLNGNLYGRGDLKYMHELFFDYVVTMKMYNREEVEFKIIKAHEDLIPNRMGNELI